MCKYSRFSVVLLHYKEKYYENQKYDAPNAPIRRNFLSEVIYEIDDWFLVEKLCAGRKITQSSEPTCKHTEIKFFEHSYKYPIGSYRKL